MKFSELPVEPDFGGYSSGWVELAVRFWPGTLIVVTGIPASGQSQWLTALGADLARVHKLPGAFVNFEDNPRWNRADLLAYAEGWSNPVLQASFRMEPEVWVDLMYRAIAARVEIEGEHITLDWLDARIEEAVVRHGCKWVVIDPWNQVEHLFSVSETET